jgi:hypothetical protein
MAFYNSKEKVIGYTNIDLSQFAGKLQSSVKLQFSKCFDKAASVSMEIKTKEQFSAINETIMEEAAFNEDSIS